MASPLRRVLRWLGFTQPNSGVGRGLPSSGRPFGPAMSAQPVVPWWRPRRMSATSTGTSRSAGDALARLLQEACQRGSCSLDGRHPSPELVTIAAAPAPRRPPGSCQRGRRHRGRSSPWCRGGAIAARPERVQTHGPCPGRALSIGRQRSFTDNHGPCPCPPSWRIRHNGAVRGSFPSSRWSLVSAKSTGDGAGEPGPILSSWISSRGTTRSRRALRGCRSAGSRSPRRSCRW